jgi:uncharacterized protein YhbP (UPF0306 family)
MTHKPYNARHAQDTAKLSDRQQHIYDFLKANPIGVLSSAAPNGDPHGAVIYFGVDEQLTISFLTKAKTRKYDNIKRHNNVALTVYEPQSQTTAQITGSAIEIENSDEINAVAGNNLSASLKTSKAGLPPISKLDAGAAVAFVIKPIQIRLVSYGDKEPGESANKVEEIETFGPIEV